jgi:5-methylcytosine-specific restriction endonuclease McrA
MAVGSLPPKQRCCTVCGQSMPETEAYFPPIHVKRKNGTLWHGFRTACKNCTNGRRLQRRYSDPAFFARMKDANKKSYQKLREKRIAEVMDRYWQIQSDPELAATYNKKKRDEHRRRRMRPEWSERHRKIARIYETKYYADPTIKKHRREAIVRRRNANPILAEQHRKRSLAWQKANPDKVKARRHRRRARRVGAEGWYSGDDVRALLEGQKFLCFWCSDDINGRHHIDHLIPLAKGGSNWPDNIVASCATCNHRKGAKMPNEFRAYLANLR